MKTNLNTEISKHHSIRIAELPPVKHFPELLKKIAQLKVGQKIFLQGNEMELYDTLLKRFGPNLATTFSIDKESKETTLICLQILHPSSPPTVKN